MTATPALSLEEARRLSTFALGVSATPRQGTVAATHALLQRLSLLQLDPLARVERAHRLTALARLPLATPGDRIDEALWPTTGQPTTFETMSGVACLFPIADWALLEPVRARARAKANTPGRAETESILDIVRASENGVTVRAIEHEGERTQGWGWSQRRLSTERLVHRGDLVVCTRRGGQRVYDLPERVIPAPLREAAADPDERYRDLVLRAVGALGIGTAADIGKHYWLPTAATTLGLRHAEEEGLVQRVSVAGWAAPAWVLPESLGPDGTAIPVQLARGARLIGPFDSLLRDRDRARRLYNFDYLFEAYKPAHTRVFGHYVLGVFQGSRFLGRVDAQRTEGTLLIRGAWPEKRVGAQRFTAATQAATQRLATQLGVVAAFPSQL